MNYPLVSTEWLDANKDNDDLFILDVSMSKVIGKEPIIYDQLITIPNSYKVTIEHDLSDASSNFTHCFPSGDQVLRLADQLGFNVSSTLVIYDNQGVYSSPRAWWIFKSFGYNNVVIIDGGLPKWITKGYAVMDTHLVNPKKVIHSDNVLMKNPTSLATSEYILLNIDSEKSTVIDVRSENRFLGIASEPRAGVRSGHIPKSINLPFGMVLDSIEYKPAKDIHAQFTKVGCQSDMNILFSCGSGITACIVLVAAIIAGFPNVSLYDGSWAEWGADASLPIAK